MKLSDKVSVPAHVMPRAVGEETVILDLANGTYFGLDPVGARIFELLSTDVSLAAVCETMFTEFEVSREDIERDVLALAQQLIEKQLVSIES